MEPGERKTFLFPIPPPDGDHPRHKRKYARAHLPEIDRFVFRGPENRLNLEAGNLLRFVELAQGVDDDTWQYHLKKGDVTRWFKNVIKDPELVEASQKARQEASTPDESRAMIKEAIEDRYTGPI